MRFSCGFVNFDRVLAQNSTEFSSEFLSETNKIEMSMFFCTTNCKEQEMLVRF